MTSKTFGQDVLRKYRYLKTMTRENLIRFLLEIIQVIQFRETPFLFCCTGTRYKRRAIVYRIARAITGVTALMKWALDQQDSGMARALAPDPPLFALVKEKTCDRWGIGKYSCDFSMKIRPN